MFVTRVQTVWFTLAIDETDHILRMRRSAKKMQSLDELIAAMERLIEEIARLVPTGQRGSWSFLQDMRAGPLLDNPDWEARQLQLVDRFRGGWRRSALLMQTAIGRLQARRLSYSIDQPAVDLARVAVFDDEIEALAYLRQTT